VPLRRLVFETLPHPRRLRALVPLLSAAHRVGAHRLAPGRLGAMVQVAPKPPAPADRRMSIPERTAPVGPSRGRVGLLLGCVQRVFYPQVHRATIGALAAEGYEVLRRPHRDCCGALELHSGEQGAALKRAQATIESFAGLGPLEHVITNSAGCGSAMKEYGDLLGTPLAREFSARVRDVCEVLGGEPPRAPRGPLEIRVAYHDACHLRHAQGVREPPREMLRAIPGLELVELPGADRHVLRIGRDLQPGRARAGRPAGASRKAELVLSTGAEVLAAANPGCVAQIGHHLELLAHPRSIVAPGRAGLALDPGRG